MQETQLIKSKDRVRDHGEVFTPDFIVEDMLKLVENETHRLDSRFLEPACGDGNFLIKVLEKKLSIVAKQYRRNQLDYEKYMFISVASIYGIDLLRDNVHHAQDRLYKLAQEEYQKIRKKKIKDQFLKSLQFVLSKNIVQWDALSLKDTNGQPIHFTEWSFVWWYKIKRREYTFEELITQDKGNEGLFSDHLQSDHGKSVFLPQPSIEHPTVHFLALIS